MELGFVVGSVGALSRRGPCLVNGRRAVVVCAAEGGKSKADKATDLMKIYGGSYLATSISTSVVSLATFYFAIEAGFDVPSMVNSFGDWLATTPLGRPAVLEQVNPSMGTFALAYIAHKATSPARFPLVVAAVPYVAKFFKKSDTEKDPSSEIK
ncbi:hypothetical protein NDN08_005028 [Rhodosorus marinus]|uniref:DUF1279 domain-containing protein n=1 Tax=Rhodosorus marinus TaxID=101924 RepID=A0AAV8V0C4_9RHOD|nr:hypothetical protein NDN08_005028 [Rhodosorus marinus]